MSERILIDTCFWIALLEPEDNIKRNQEAQNIADTIADEIFVIPFPTLYEFVNSRLSRKEHRNKFSDILNKPNVLKVSDEIYKEIALEKCFMNKHYVQDISLVDEVIKLMLQDISLNIKYIVTFDEGLKNSAISMGKKSL